MTPDHFADLASRWAWAAFVVVSMGLFLIRSIVHSFRHPECL